jgi:6-phosphogluconolactonase
MGPDGHTASLFPNHELLNENELLVASISDSPKLPPKRITLTYPVINGGRNVLFVAAGGSKAENLPKVIPSGSTMSHNGGDVVSINHDDVSKESLLPAARVRPSMGSLHFYVDDDAASLLAPTSDL